MARQIRHFTDGNKLEQEQTETKTNMSADQIDLLCEHCGQTLSAFLHEMAENNAKLVCPNCGESRDSTNGGGVK
jgi:predicted RNA-binding Zn-ribbon protein involved in translation (DUF1610 family)